MNKGGLLALIGVLLLLASLGIGIFAGAFLQPTVPKSTQAFSSGPAPSLVVTPVPDRAVMNAISSIVTPEARIVSYNQMIDAHGYEDVRLIWRPILQRTREATFESLKREIYGIMRAIYSAGPLVSSAELDARASWKTASGQHADQTVLRVVLTREAAERVQWSLSSLSSLMANLTILQALPSS